MFSSIAALLQMFPTGAHLKTITLMSYRSISDCADFSLTLVHCLPTGSCVPGHICAPSAYWTLIPCSCVFQHTPVLLLRSGPPCFSCGSSDLFSCSSPSPLAHRLPAIFLRLPWTTTGTTGPSMRKKHLLLQLEIIRTTWKNTVFSAL